MNLEKYDRVIVSKEDMAHIIQWEEDYFKKHGKGDNVDFPMSEGVIEIEQEHEQLGINVVASTYFKVNEDIFEVRQFTKGEEFFSFKIGGEENEFYDIKTNVRSASKEDIDRSARMTTYLIFCVFQYMSHMTRNVVESKELKSIRKKQKGKKASKNNRNRVVKLSVTKYTFNHAEPTKSYERHVMGWNVRGHWRQLKSGKRVWIKPHAKGDKEQIEAKEYRL